MTGLAQAPFHPAAENPCPEGGEAFFVEPDPGVRVRGAVWRGGSRGTMIVLPGRTEYIEKYFETIGDMRARGFAVVCIDWRGQGASTRPLPDPLKGHVGDFSEYRADLSAVMAAVESALPRPLVILAHSMGGTIALSFLHDGPGRFAGAVLSAPMTGLKVGRSWPSNWLIGQFPATAFVLGGRDFNPYKERFSKNPVTHDPVRFARNLAIINSHRGLALGAPTWGWLRAALASTRDVMAPGHPEAIKTPALILTAGEEQILDKDSQKEHARRMPQATYAEFAAARHELFQETDAVRTDVLRRVDAFTAGIAP